MTNETTVPFVDLVEPNVGLKQELQEVFNEVLSSGIAIGGPFVERFENEFAKFCGVKHCIGVGSGTDALRFALIAAGIGKGDAVLTVPNTFIATGEAITQTGAVCRFIDIDPATSNLSIQALSEYLETKCDRNDKTGIAVDRATRLQIKAVVPVHLYGQMANMSAITAIAEKYRLKVIEDACQAHGAEWNMGSDTGWKKAGSIGQSGAFSFYPAKNLGAIGEGGAVTTNDDRIAADIRMIRDHGQRKKYFHATEGYNGRLDAIQAGFLNVKLKYLADGNSKRSRLAKRYTELLQDLKGVELPNEPSLSRSVYHLYVIRTEMRDDLQQYLKNNGIATGLHYPLPLHLQEAYQYLGFKRGDFPVSERVASQILSLPMYPQMRDDQQMRVVDAIKRFYSGRTEVVA